MLQTLIFTDVLKINHYIYKEETLFFQYVVILFFKIFLLKCGKLLVYISYPQFVDNLWIKA